MPIIACRTHLRTHLRTHSYTCSLIHTLIHTHSHSFTFIHSLSFSLTQFIFGSIRHTKRCKSLSLFHSIPFRSVPFLFGHQEANFNLSYPNHAHSPQLRPQLSSWRQRAAWGKWNVASETQKQQQQQQAANFPPQLIKMFCFNALDKYRRGGRGGGKGRVRGCLHDETKIHFHFHFPPVFSRPLPLSLLLSAYSFAYLHTTSSCFLLSSPFSLFVIPSQGSLV